MSINITNKKKKTKEDYFCLINYMNNVLELESILPHYDLEYSNVQDFPLDFYKFLDIKHFLTESKKIKKRLKKSPTSKRSVGGDDEFSLFLLVLDIFL